MENLNSKMERLEWRRNKVLEYSSKGHSQPEIARILQVGLATVNRDISYLRHQSKQNIRRYIDERLPEEYEKCMVGPTSILREAWNTATNAQDKREKIQALSLAKDCYSMKLDLLTNATVVDDAIRFVEEKSAKFHTTDASTPVENIENHGKEIQENNKHMSTINQIF
jgi:hypothetical protein